MQQYALGLGTSAAVLASAFCAPALAGDLEWPGARGDGVVFEQVPNQLGGPPSDTSYTIFGQPEATQQVAEDIVLDAPAAIRRIRWFGFYNLNNPPIMDELFRLRIYPPRPGDNLPDEPNVLREEFFVDPVRTATGMFIGAPGFPDEYLYQVDLATPFPMLGSTLYWLEIVQIGDFNTAFRWELALGDTGGAAVKGTFVPGDDWMLFSTTDTSFQLSTIPEPASLAFGVLVACVILKRGTV